MRILTCRKNQDWVSFDLVYEWEDILSKELNFPLLYENTKFTNKYVRQIPYIYLLHTLGGKTFSFEMGPELRKKYRACRNIRNYFPCIIDYFLKDEDLGLFEKQYSRHKIVFVTSKEVYDRLHSLNCKLNIQHLPLSLSDKYKISKDTRYEKEFDLVLMGRQNPVLLGFLEQYIKKHPDFYYVYRVENERSFEKKFIYKTNRGEVIGDIVDREQYFDLMRKARIGLYSTPGTDDTSGRTNGFSQVTPRLFEYLSCGCHVIARYINNSDTQFYGLDKYWPSITTYDDFERAMDLARSTEPDMRLYSDFLSKHYTSVRAKQLKILLESI